MNQTYVTLPSVPVNPLPICPVCNAEGKTRLSEIRDYFIHEGNSPDFEVSFCEKCKMGFSIPPMTEEELSSYYPKEYEPHTKKKGFRALLQSLKYRLDLKLVQRLAPHDKASVYEIGPGNAEFLSHLKQYGYKVSGMEPGQEGRECALKNWGIQLEDGFAKDLHFQTTYDIVIARYVLEHVNQPRELLETIFHSGLKSGGTLLVKIPNMQSWEAKFFGPYWCGWDEPRHRVHFTPDGIYKLLKNIGFKDIKISFEVAPVDLPKNLDYWARYSKHSHSISARVILALLKLPEPILLLGTQVIGTLLKPLGAGRMTVTARRA